MSIYEWYYFVPIIINNNSFASWNTLHKFGLHNNDKNLAPIIQLYVLIFNVENYNIHITMF